MEGFKGELADFLSVPPLRIHDLLENSDDRKIFAFFFEANQASHMGNSDDAWEKARSLWTLLISIQQNPQDTVVTPDTVAIARFAVFECLYSCTQKTRQSSFETRFERIIFAVNVGISAIADCTKRNHLELAQQIVEQIGEPRSQLKEPAEGWSDKQTETWHEIDCRFYCARTAVACEQGKGDLATLMYKKAIECAEKLSTEYFDNIVLLGAMTAQKKFHSSEFGQAIWWSTLALDVLVKFKTSNPESHKQLTLEISEILIQSLIAGDVNDNATQIRNTIDKLEVAYPYEPRVQELRLDFLGQLPTFEIKEYFNSLQNLMDGLSLTDGNYKRVIWRFYKLHEHSHSEACKALEELLVERMEEMLESSWALRSFIDRIDFALRGPNHSEAVQSLLSLLRKLGRRSFRKPSLPRDISNAAQMYLWKVIETCYTNQDYSQAEKWCEVFEHPMIGADENLAVVYRKHILCLFEQGEFDGMKPVFASLSETIASAPNLTLMEFWKAAKRTDFGEMSRCLKSLIIDRSVKLPTIICCVVGAAGSNPPYGTLWTMLILRPLHRDGHISAQGMFECHKYALRTLIPFPEHTEGGVGRATGRTTCVHILEDVCSSMEGSQIDRFTVNELKFLTKVCAYTTLSYERNTTGTEIVHVVEIYRRFMEIARLYPPNEAFSEMSVNYLICLWTALRACMVNASTLTAKSEQISMYGHARKYAGVFKDCYLMLQTQGQVDNIEHLSTLYEKVLVSGFRAAIAMREPFGILKMVKELVQDGPVGIVPLYAGGVLTSNLPSNCTIFNQVPFTLSMLTNLLVTYTIIEDLAVVAIQPDDFDGMSRWFHLLYELALKMNPIVPQQIDKVVDGISRAIERSQGQYPQREIDWVATNIFNRAIDAFVSSHDTLCAVLVNQALRLASQMEDNGALTRRLYENLEIFDLEKLDTNTVEQ